MALARRRNGLEQLDLTTTAAAKALGVSPRRVRQLIRERRLPAIKFGRDLFIRTEDLRLVQTRHRGRPRGYSPKDAGRELDPVELGRALRHLRKSYRLTQKELARRAQVSGSYISRLESGGYPRPPATMLARLSQIYGLGEDELRTTLERLSRLAR